MRIVMNQYADGEAFAVETATDGSVDQRELLGKRKVGARISAYADVACDDNDKGMERLENTLLWLVEEVRKRRRQPAGV
jgi:hypothetical protein